MDKYQIERIHSRIRDILGEAPADSWSLEESMTVLSALTDILRTRQQCANVLGIHRTLA